MDSYLLRHRNTPVVEFEIDREAMVVTGIEVLDEKFSPVNILSGKMAQGVSFNNWLSARCIPNSREGIQRLKSEYKVSDLKEIMFMRSGLSLSDHYWIDKKPYGRKWEDINLFENGYDGTFGKVLFDSNFKMVINRNDYGAGNPDVTTGGNLRKYWEFDKNQKKSFLIKAGGSLQKQEPFNEYFSSMLFERIKFNHVDYSLRSQNGEWVSVCPCMVDLDKEFVSAEDLRMKYGLAKSYESLVRLGKEHGCMGFQNSLDEMIVGDFLILNTDRHWGNFGILRDSISGSMLGLAPLFDNGYSLWNNQMVNPNDVSHSSSFADTNEDCLLLVRIEDHVKKMPDMLAIFDKAFENYGDNDRKNMIRWGLSVRQREAEELITEGIKVRSEKIEKRISLGNTLSN